MPPKYCFVVGAETNADKIDVYSNIEAANAAKKEGESVVKKELKSKAEKPAAAANTKAKSSKKSAPEPEPEDEDDGEEAEEEEAAPAKKKKAAPKKAAKKASSKTTIPDGVEGVLEGFKLLFTGTFESMDRDTSVATAETYGGEIVKKLDDADWIIMGVRAGQKKIDEINEKGLKTMNEAEFLEFLRNGEPPKKKQKV